MSDGAFVGLKRVGVDAVDAAAPAGPDAATLDVARSIVDDVRTRGELAVRENAERFGERANGEPLVVGRAEMERALSALDAEDRAALERAAERVRVFAEAQRGAVREVTVPVPGGEAGHTVEAVGAAGCYSPGGRYPLPSTALMTAVTARAARCERVVVASPGAHPVVLAAAAIAGADEVLAVGGAHAVAAMAYGFDSFERVDVIAGPGNRYVTAAKQLVSASVGIDMLAGPSELLVIADGDADAGLIAADLLAQAEHDADARPILVTTSEEVAAAVDAEIVRRLSALSTRETAEAALANGFVVIVGSMDEACAVSDRIAPEHLQVMTKDAAGVAARLRNAGALFIGERSAEVFGDYGAGPNHTLPTGGTARFCAGLSVMDFLRLRTWLRIDEQDEGLIADTERIARMEGLAGHLAAARARRGV